MLSDNSLHIIAEDGSAPAERFVLDLALHGYRLRDYLVVVLQDADGNRAWSSAIDMEVQVTPG